MKLRRIHILFLRLALWSVNRIIEWLDNTLGEKGCSPIDTDLNNLVVGLKRAIKHLRSL